MLPLSSLRLAPSFVMELSKQKASGTRLFMLGRDIVFTQTMNPTSQKFPYRVPILLNENLKGCVPIYVGTTVPCQMFCYNYVTAAQAIVSMRNIRASLSTPPLDNQRISAKSIKGKKRTSNGVRHARENSSNREGHSHTLKCKGPHREGTILPIPI